MPESTRFALGVRDLAGLALGGISAAGVHFAIFRYFDRRDLSWCGDGLDGLGCAIFSVFIVAALAVTVGAIVNWLVLRACRVRFAGPTAFIATLAFAGWWLFIDSLITGTNWAVVPIVAPPVILNVLAAALFQVVPPRKATVVGVAAIVVLASFPLFNQGNELEAKRQRNEERAGIANADFVTYVPTFLPAGFEANEVQFHQFGDEPAFSEVSALHGNNNILEGDPSPFTVVSFHVPSTFGPPNHCGSDRPYGADSGLPCTEIGRTTAGDPLYVDNGATFSNRQTFFVVRGTTLVTLNTTSDDDEMPRSTVMRILDGLRPYRP